MLKDVKMKIAISDYDKCKTKCSIFTVPRMNFQSVNYVLEFGIDKKQSNNATNLDMESFDSNHDCRLLQNPVAGSFLTSHHKQDSHYR